MITITNIISRYFPSFPKDAGYCKINGFSSKLSTKFVSFALLHFYCLVKGNKNSDSDYCHLWGRKEGCR